MIYDLAVLGGGPGGYTAADAAAKAGLSVVLFEKDLLGGTCLNRGCIPTKALLHGSELFRAAKSGQDWGMNAESLSCDFAALQSKKNALVATLRQGVERLMKSDKVTVVGQKATVLSVTDQGVTLQARDETYEAKELIVAAGSVPAVPPIPGADLPGIVTSNGILEGGGLALSSLAIIGGGVIGCEIASVYANLGAQVTILEAADRLLPTMDKEIGQRLALCFKKQGIAVSVACRVTEIEEAADGLTVAYTDKAGKACAVTAQGVLIATGRRAAAEGLFTGEAPDMERGAILADEAGRTSLPHVYVIGDAKAGTLQLAHLAEAQARNAVAAIRGLPLPVDTGTVPACVYTQPEIASVGLTEEAARAAGRAVKAKKIPSGANGKCVIESSDPGFVKVLTDADSGVVLGAQLVCPRATELVAEFALAISLGLKAEQVASVIHPHPTVSEIIAEACRD